MVHIDENGCPVLKSQKDLTFLLENNQTLPINTEDSLDEY